MEGEDIVQLENLLKTGQFSAYQDGGDKSCVLEKDLEYSREQQNPANLIMVLNHGLKLNKIHIIIKINQTSSEYSKLNNHLIYDIFKRAALDRLNDGE